MIDPSNNSTILTVFITVTDVDDTAPIITSATSVNFEENETSVAYEATADEDVIFALGDAKDESLFTLTNENEVRFDSPPDFENSLDNDSDNNYLIDIIATDLELNSSTLEVIVTVTDADENSPVFTSGNSVSVDENIPVSTVIYTATTTDEGIVNYSLGGTDESSLLIGSSSGALTFVSSPDFETQSTYSIAIIATDDSGNSADLSLTITINDLTETTLGLETVKDLTIYPNSVVNIFSLKGNLNAIQQINIIDMEGKVLKQFELNDANEYHIGNLPHGTYLLTMSKNGNEKLIGRLIKD